MPDSVRNKPILNKPGLQVSASFSTSFEVPWPTKIVYDAVLDVRGWWSDRITGETGRLGDVFHFSDEGITSSSFRLAELVAERRVVWEIDDAYLAFVDDHDEWTDTHIVFEIEQQPEGSIVHFSHHGLLPTVACFQACSAGWSQCMTSLQRLIESTGHREPTPGLGRS